jgi:Na+-driven multidrug efflux pump
MSFSISSSAVNGWKKLTSLGIPAALTNMLGPLANGILVAWVAGYGTQAVAAYGVGSRIEPIALIVIFAFTASLPPFVGQNHGAGEFKRIETALMKSMRFILVWQLLVYAVLVTFAAPLSHLFSDDPGVQDIIQTFIYILPISYFGMGFSLVCTATINALHKTRVSLNINILRLFALYIPMAWVGNHFWGLEGIFWGCAAGNIAIGLFILHAFKKVRHSHTLKNKLLAV